jgi:Zn-dependent peptidase ImmA (M78 family)
LELEKVLGLPADFWMNSETSYQLTRARQRERIELEKQEDWLDFFPVRQMRERGYLPKTKDKQETLAAILRFFGVATFSALRLRQEHLVDAHDYHLTPKSKVSDGALWAWLRAGSLKAREIETRPYSQQRFRAALSEVRALTRESSDVYFPKMLELCANAGVALVVEQEFPKSGASGVARWLAADKAMIQLSTKWRWVDHFWFNFFHEAHHILNRDKRHTFINGINDDQTLEEQANVFAEDTLMPRAQWETFVSGQSPLGSAVVQEFADDLGIHACIIVGRLQHDRLIGFNRLNELRPRFIWKEVKEEK